MKLFGHTGSTSRIPEHSENDETDRSPSGGMLASAEKEPEEVTAGEILLVPGMDDDIKNRDVKALLERENNWKFQGHWYKCAQRSYTFFTDETKNALKLSSFVKIGEPTDDDETRAAEAFTAVDGGKGPHQEGQVCHIRLQTDGQMAKPVVKSGLSKRWLVHRSGQLHDRRHQPSSLATDHDNLRGGRGTAARFARQGDSLELAQDKAGPELEQQMVTSMMRKLAKREHSYTRAQLDSRISAVMKLVAEELTRTLT